MRILLQVVAGLVLLAFIAIVANVFGGWLPEHASLGRVLDLASGIAEAIGSLAFIALLAAAALGQWPRREFISEDIALGTLIFIAFTLVLILAALRGHAF